MGNCLLLEPIGVIIQMRGVILSTSHSEDFYLTVGLRIKQLASYFDLVTLHQIVVQIVSEQIHPHCHLGQNIVRL